MIAGQLVATQLIAAVEAKVTVASKQRGVGQRGGWVDRTRARMPARGDNRVQFNDALLAAVAVGAATHDQTGGAQRPGDGIARVQAGSVLPADPVQNSTVRIERENAGRMRFAGKNRPRREGDYPGGGVAWTGDDGIHYLLSIKQNRDVLLLLTVAYSGLASRSISV